MVRVNSMRIRSFPESFEHLFSMTNCRIGGVDRTLPPSLRFPDGGARIITPQSNRPGGLDSPPAPFQAPPQPRPCHADPPPAHVSSSSSNPLFSVSFPLLQRQEAAAIHPLEWGGRESFPPWTAPYTTTSLTAATKRARRELRARLPTLRLFSDPLLYPRRPGKQATERDSDRVPFGPPSLFFLLKEKLGEGGKGVATAYSRASSFSLKFFLPSNKKTDAVWVGSKRGRIVHGRCVGVGG